jgi:polysaccharide deacetylase 2 family uncharacterized protein YibQ
MATRAAGGLDLYTLFYTTGNIRVHAYLLSFTASALETNTRSKPENMPKKKSTPPKKTAKSSKARSANKSGPSLQKQIIKGVMGLCLLVGLAVGGGIGVQQWLGERPAAKPHKSAAPERSSVHRVPRYEVYPPEKQKPVPHKKAPAPKKKLPSSKPRIAIVIDDLGVDLRLARKFIRLDKGLTMSILPHNPYTKKIAQEVHAAGMLSLLHLPMEPFEYPKVNPGQGTLLVSMAPDEFIRMLSQNIADVPFIKGVNNHMGSRMTTTSTKMYQIFSILKKKNLFFVDSRTTAESLCKPSARLLKVPFAERDVFIDHLQTPEAIDGQLERLVAIAYEKGAAIGIGHPYPETYQALRKRLPHLKKKTQLVPVSNLVHVVGQADSLAKR